jgi:NAD(P)-dependent dehydrogenase (short-subunit alcohol dehydrogenase family)
MRAVIAGAGSGIGAATGRLFAARGHDVVLADLNAEGLARTAELIAGDGRTAHVITFDTTDLGSCDQLMTRAVELLGGIDTVVTTVGWTETHSFLEEDPAYWAKVLDINLLGSVKLTHAALGPLIAGGGGSIVLTASEAGKVGTVGETIYAAAKAGVIGFVKSTAREVARHGIRINATAPGVTETPMLRAQADQERVVDRTIKAIPMRRISQPEEQAEALYFLACDAAGYITGQTLSVSGGLSMNS